MTTRHKIIEASKKTKTIYSKSWAFKMKAKDPKRFEEVDKLVREFADNGDIADHFADVASFYRSLTDPKVGLIDPEIVSERMFSTYVRAVRRGVK